MGKQRQPFPFMTLVSLAKRCRTASKRSRVVSQCDEGYDEGIEKWNIKSNHGADDDGV
jgi:hypothetical protein